MQSSISETSTRDVQRMTESKEITYIKPGGAIAALDLAEIWRYRELLYFLTLRDIKLRYKQTLIGVAWAVLQPILTTAIFTVIFSNFARFDTGAIAYPLFALSGLIIWLFVHTSVSFASSSFVSNANLVTKVYFPRLIVPIAATFGTLFDLVFGVIILIGMMFYFGVAVTSQILLAPLFVVLGILVAVTFGTLFSALNVRFRDVKFALPFLLQVWMIASPIFYPTSLLSEKWRLVFALNPLTGVIEGFRSALFGSAFDWTLIGVSVGSLLFFMLISLVVFKSMEDSFADVI
ncbi:MAG: phosphate ABC transporter permease [Acidobacteria bacterium]|nr:MAG: phosphate ABC transporter permease [Acidobacteriota bacterium]